MASNCNPNMITGLGLQCFVNVFSIHNTMCIIASTSVQVFQLSPALDDANVINNLRI